ncbi:MAG: glycosyltransferase family 39 protein [Gemmataceae bacterium]|nr:glycosyltransferase family 39 protein [Gemmataceae bacterium]
MTATISRAKLYLLPCLLLLCMTAPHLEQGDFRRDTGRYAAVGHYMWSGGQVGVPYLNPETPYFNKPPLALVIHGLFLKIFGVSVAVARIPSIIASLGVVIMSMAAARQIGTRAEAVVSGFVLASTYEYFRRAREISLDLWQLFFMMGAVVLILRGLRTGKPWWIVGGGLPLGLALLCKPLVGLLVIPIALGWCTWAKQGRLSVWLLVGTLPLAVLVALPWHWHMYSLFGDNFLQQYFGKEVLDRARGLHLKQPLYYYLDQNLRTYWPWLAAVAFAIVHGFRHRAVPAVATHRAAATATPSDRVRNSRSPRRDLVFFGLWWSALLLVFLSIFPDKKPNYALPLYPMLSWVAAAGICRLPWKRLREWYEQGFPWLATSTALLLIALSIAPIQFQKGADSNWKRVLDWVSGHGGTAETLFHAGLEANDICYFYLKTGRWLRPWNGEANANVEGIILTRATQAPALLSDARFSPAISAGNYVVLVALSGGGP